MIENEDREDFQDFILGSENYESDKIYNEGLSDTLCCFIDCSI